MMSRKTYLYTWLTVQWLAMFPAAAAFSYLFFSDTHGLPTTGFFVSTLTIIGLVTAGYVIAVRILMSRQEGS